METRQAPAGGRLNLGNDSSAVYVPGLKLSLRFQYITEPPHGDALLQLFCDGCSLPGWVWGSDSWWSPSGRWLLLQWSDERPGFCRQWRLIDLREWRWTPVDMSKVLAIDDETIHGHAIGGAATALNIPTLPGWADLPTPARLAAIDPAIDRLRPRG